MKRYFLAALICAAAFAGLTAQDRPVVAVDSKGFPVVAWVEGDEKHRSAFVKRWDGKVWQSLGGALNIDRRNSVPYVAVAVDSDDRPVAAWAEEERGRPDGEDFGKIWVARWEAGVWKRFASSPSRSDRTQSDIPILKVDRFGNPSVFWNETSRNTDVDHYFLSRWDGRVWLPIDPGTLSTDLSSSSRGRDFALDRAGRPVLAWSPYVYKRDFNVFAGRWDGSRWQPFGESLNIDPNRYASSPAIALDSEDRPTVAFVQAKAGFDLWVKRWTGRNWELLGESLNAASGGARNPRIVLGNDRPVVAYVDNLGNDKLFVKTWNGGSWTGLGGILNKDLAANVRFYSLAYAAGTGPIVVWSEEVLETRVSSADESLSSAVSSEAGRTSSRNTAIHIAAWDGKSWKDYP